MVYATDRLVLEFKICIYLINLKKEKKSLVAVVEMENMNPTVDLGFKTFSSFFSLRNRECFELMNDCLWKLRTATYCLEL